MKDKIL